MCGRYQTTKEAQEIERIFEIKINKKIYKKSYNAAPSQNLPIIANNDPSQVQFFRWGLIPVWAKDQNIGYKMINARIETISEKPTFKNLVNKKRCLVITDGYFEWMKTKEGKQPFRICLKDKSLFAYAGLWSEWQNPNEEIIPTFTIITTEAHKSIEHIHNRMPVMLNVLEAKRWILNEIESKDLLSSTIKEKQLINYPVSKKVSSPANNTQDLVEPIEL